MKNYSFLTSNRHALNFIKLMDGCVLGCGTGNTKGLGHWGRLFLVAATHLLSALHSLCFWRLLVCVLATPQTSQFETPDHSPSASRPPVCVPILFHIYHRLHLCKAEEDLDYFANVSRTLPSTGQWVQSFGVLAVALHLAYHMMWKNHFKPWGRILLVR